MTVDPVHTKTLGDELESRSHRAYWALWQAAHAYCDLVSEFDDLDVKKTHIQLEEGAWHIEKVHQALTNQPFNQIETFHHGIAQAESYLPLHPDETEEIRN